MEHNTQWGQLHYLNTLLLVKKVPGILQTCRILARKEVVLNCINSEYEFKYRALFKAPEASPCSKSEIAALYHPIGRTRWDGKQHCWAKGPLLVKEGLIKGFFLPFAFTKVYYFELLNKELWLFTLADNDRKRGNISKLDQESSRLDVTRKFLTVSVVRLWDRLPREAEAVPHSLKRSRPGWTGFGANRSNGNHPCPWHGVGTKNSLRSLVTRNLSWLHNSLILYLCQTNTKSICITSEMWHV